MADKILCQMAMFDFSAPVETVTVFDDDSNEEKYFPSPKRYKTDYSIATHILHHEVDIVSSSDEDVLQNGERIECVLKEKNEDSVPANCTEKNSHNPKQVNMEMSKHKENSCSKSNSIQCENVISGSNGDEKRNEQQTLHNKEPTQPINNENVSKEPMPDQVNAVTSFSWSSLDSDKQAMACYLKELIHTVSEILLKILEAYRLYINVQNKGNPIIVEKSRLYYIQTKHHFFQLAFLIVKTIFIPQNHSYTFGRNFIECTLRISNKKILNNSYQEIETIYLEMIEWTKEKCKDFERKNIFYFTQLSQNLHTFTDITKEKVSNSCIHNTPVYRNININCPPVPQQNVNISPGLLTNTNKSPGLQQNVNIAPRLPINLNSSTGLQQNVNIPPRHPKNLNNSSGLQPNLNISPRHPIKTNSPGLQQYVKIAPRLPINLNSSTAHQKNGIIASGLQQNINSPPGHPINLNNSLGQHNVNIPTGLQKTGKSLPGLQQKVNELNVHQKNTSSLSRLQQNDTALSGRQKNVVQPHNQSNTVHFTVPSYNEANNLPRNSVANVENYVYSHHPQPQNCKQDPQSLPSVTYPGGFYNNLQNSTESTCSTNMPYGILHSAISHQTRHNNGAP